MFRILQKKYVWGKNANESCTNDDKGEGLFSRISRRHLLSENDQLKTFLMFHTELQLARQHNKTHTVSSIRFSFVPVQLLLRTSSTLFKTTIRFPFVYYSRIFYFAKHVRNASAVLIPTRSLSIFSFRATRAADYVDLGAVHIRVL